MGKVWASEFVTLDGVVEAPEEWMAPVASEESYRLLGRDVESAHRMVLGATTFTELSSFWPYQGDDVPMATLTNQMPKTVASTSLREASWGPDTQVVADVVSYVHEITTQDTDLVVSGSPQIVQALIAARALDELRLFLVPTVRGHGKKLFAEAGTSLALRESEALPHGLLYLRYTLG
jgi:dihydrofolate reductase